jgi:hypothetical protein
MIDEDGGRKGAFMRQLLVTFLAIGAALVSAGGAGADPVRHFDTFVIDCGTYGTVEIVSKPGSSQVVALNGAPSNSIALLMGYELSIGGQLIDFTPGAQYQPPGQQDRGNLVVCFDTSVPPPDYFKAFVLFTPAHGR